MFSTPFISTALTLLVGSAAFGAPATTPCANYLCPATDDAGLLLAGSWFTPSPYGHQYHRCDYSTTGTPDTFQNNTTNTCWYDFQPQYGGALSGGESGDHDGGNCPPTAVAC